MAAQVEALRARQDVIVVVGALLLGGLAVVVTALWQRGARRDERLARLEGRATAGERVREVIAAVRERRAKRQWVPRKR